MIRLAPIPKTAGPNMVGRAPAESPAKCAPIRGVNVSITAAQLLTGYNLPIYGPFIRWLGNREPTKRKAREYLRLIRA